MSSRDISSSNPDAVAGVRFDLEEPHAQPVGFLGPGLEFQQIDQCPARLGNGRIELSACFQQVSARMYRLCW